MSSKNFYGLTGDVTIDGGILNVANTNVSGNVTSTSLFVSNVATLGTTKTFVVRASGGAYYIDEEARKSLELHEGQTYIFDLSHSSLANSGLPNGEHPLEFATEPEGANSSEYTTGISSTGTAGTTGAKKTFMVSAGAPTTLYYYCTRHPGMGGQINISPAAELVVSGRIVASGNVEASKITASANVEVTGNVVASTFVGDGSLLTGISTVTSSGLQVVTDNSPTTTNTIQFTNPTTSLRASSNIVATGNVTADHFIGDGSRLSGIVTSVSLGDAVNTGNITSNTVQFTNTSTSLTASGNVEVAGNVVTSGNVEAAYFIGDGSQLSGIVTSVTLGDAVNTGNITSNTVQFTNTSTSLTASGNVEVVGNVVAAYFVGDGSKLTGISGGGSGSGTSHWTKTVGTNELSYTAGSVGISNANPIHDLSVGSNLYVDDDATDGILRVTGNVVATHFVGDGSRLSGLPGGAASSWSAPASGGTLFYPPNPVTTPKFIGVMNNTPQHTLSVGSNLFVDDTGSNVLVVDGDITAESMFLGALGIKPSYPLDTVTEVGNVTPHTISFTNPTLSITTASNVEIGGALVVGKGTLGGSNLEVGEANLFVNTDLTRVGIGTDQPEATLHVNGDLSVGGVINMGIINVVAQHSLEAVTATGNTTPLTIELQNADTSLVTTGNVEVGGELNVSGNVTVSSNLTVSGNVSDLNVVSNVNMLHTSNTASIKLNSNVVTEFPRSKKLIKYPRVAMTQDDESGTSGYVADASTEESNNTGPWKAFNGDEGAWEATPIRFNQNTGDWDGTTTTPYAISLVGSDTIYGEWVELKIPNKIQLHTCRIAPMTNIFYANLGKHRSPRDGYILGRVGATGNWTVLKNWSGLISGWEDLVLRDFDIENQLEYYDYFRVVWTAINGNNNYSVSAGSGYASAGEIEFLGVPEYDPDAHGVDVVVKSLPNVPNTDWLEVYYDAKNYSGSGDVQDESGNDRDGTLYGDTSLNSADGIHKFDFDGSGDYIVRTGIPTPTGAGNFIHTVSMWFKVPSLATTGILWGMAGETDGTIGNPSTSAAPHAIVNTSGAISWAMWGNDAYTSTGIIQANRWHHCVWTYSGDSSFSPYTGRRVFLDGVEQMVSGGTGALNMINATSRLTIGIYPHNLSSNPLNGSIANFRLFNRALTSDEIYQLYAYQKEYFGHSTNNMTLKAGRLGIGTSEPRAMLDVRDKLIVGHGAIKGNAVGIGDLEVIGSISIGALGAGVFEPSVKFYDTSGGHARIYLVSNDVLGFEVAGYTKGYLRPDSGVVWDNFTGQHRTFIKDVPFSQASNLEGLIVSSDQNKYIKMSGGIEAGSNAITTNESLPIVSLSNVVTDKKCFGVISASEDPEERRDAFGNFVSVTEKEKGDTRVYINSVGEGAIWVSNISGSLEAGDYITTSNVAGYGQKQESEFLANYTVAKITMDCDFEPATQPVQVIRKDETGENVLDEHDQIQWEDHPTETEKAYKLRYLTIDGTQTDEANAVHTAAFVGCTYHCG